MWGRGKVACWRTKAAISLKRIKIEEKLLWTTYRNWPTLFRKVPSSTPSASPSSKIGVRNPHWKLQCKISGKRVLIKEEYVWRAYRNSSTLINDDRNSSTLFRTVPSPTLYGLPSSRLGVCNLATLLAQEQVKLRTSNLAGTFTAAIRIKAH